MISDDTTLSRTDRFFLVLLASTLLFYALFSLSGCSKTAEGPVYGFVSTYVDPETGVNYMEFKSGDAGGICVRVNADGTPYVSEVGE